MTTYAKHLFNAQLDAANGDHLKGAAALLKTMTDFPDTRTDAAIEATSALLRAAQAAA